LLFFTSENIYLFLDQGAYMPRFILHKFPHLEKLEIGVKRINFGKNQDMHIHDHNFSELAVILQAEGAEHCVERRAVPIKRGDILLIHPGVFHAYRHTKKLELVNLLYNLDKLPLPQLDGGGMALFRFLVSADELNAPPPEKPLVHLEEADLLKLDALIRSLEEELQGNALGKHLSAFSLFLAILSLLGRAGGAVSYNDPGGSASAALAYINMNFCKKIQIAQLARISCLSERSLFRRFRELTGYTPIEYRKKKQLERAEELLRNTELLIGEIAAECGFSDSNHLIKVFSAHYGMPPARYRRKRT